jgi:hypothetical protein
MLAIQTAVKPKTGKTTGLAVFAIGVAITSGLGVLTTGLALIGEVMRLGTKIFPNAHKSTGGNWAISLLVN